MIEFAGDGGGVDVVVGVGAGTEVDGGDAADEAATFSELEGDVLVVGAASGFA